MANYQIDPETVKRYLNKHYQISNFIQLQTGTRGGFIFFTGRYRDRKVFIKCRPNVSNTEFVCNRILYRHNPHNFVEPLLFDDNKAFGIAVFEYFEGKTLDKFIETNQLTDEMKINVASQIARIYSTLCETQLVHRDIHPLQFMMNNEGRLVLIDFNAMAPAESSATKYDGIFDTTVILTNWPKRKAVETWDDAPHFLKVIDSLKPFPKECRAFEQEIADRIGTNIYIQKHMAYHKAKRLLLRPLIRICAGMIPSETARRNFRARFFDKF